MMSYLKFWRRWCARVGQTRVRRMQRERTPRLSWVAQVLEERTLLSSITVTSLADNLLVDGQITLREALLAANSNASVDGSTAGEGAGVQDVIVFQPGLTGTIELAQGQLSISQSVRIVGLGASGTSIDANELSRVFDITDTAGNVTFEGMTITGGKTTTTGDSGGGIRFLSPGTLTLTESVVSGNTTAGINAFGGGLYTKTGGVILRGSLLSENTTTGRAGDGAAIFSQNAPITLINSTVSGNFTAGYHADAAIYTIGGLASIDIVNSTITNNFGTGTEEQGGGGVVIIRAPVTIINSIVSGNHLRDGSDFDIGISGYANPATFTATHSLIGTNTNNPLPTAPVGSPDANGNLIGTPDNPIDALLGPLADNGGMTRTHALFAGSAAIDAGDNTLAVDPITLAPLTTDQRGAGFSRIDHGTVDMGSFEGTFASYPIRVPNPTLVVTTATDELDSDLSDPNDLSLREALALANAHFGPDVITFAPALGDVPFLLALGQLTVTDDVRIVGLGARHTTIDAQQDSRVIDVPLSGVDLAIEGMMITGGRTTANFESGGAIRMRWAGSLTLVESALSGNSTAGTNAFGGAIYSKAAEVTLQGSLLSGNSTEGQAGDGAAIFSRNAPLTLVNSTVSSNFTAGFHADAAIYTIGGLASLTLVNSTVTNNHGIGTEEEGGGGVVIIRAPVTIINSIVSGNRRRDGSDFDVGISGYANPATFTATHSLIGVNTGNPLPEAPLGIPDANGNLIGTAARPINARLKPVADNGGATNTHKLRDDSPAIDRGDNALAIDPVTLAPLATDQRGSGFPRVDDTTVDMGSFELSVTALPLIVTTATDELDGELTDPDDLSLREAVALANVRGGAQTITFSPALGGVPIRLSLGTLLLTDTVTISGLGAPETVIDGQSLSRVFDVTPGAGDVTLTGVTITGGRTTLDNQPGAGIRFLSSGVLTLLQCDISANSTGGFLGRGAGIYNNIGSVVLHQSLISGNTTAGRGGDGSGIFSQNGPVTLTNSTVSGNAPSGYHGDGAAIYTDGPNGAITLINSTVTGNTNTGPGSTGAAVSSVRGDLTILNSIVAGNTILYGDSPDVRFINYSGTAIFTAQHSLIGVVNGSPLSEAPPGSPDVDGNITGTFENPLDPRLGPLADNGGPTKTHALLGDSPAINAGSNSLNPGASLSAQAASALAQPSFGSDQRGGQFQRIELTTVDIGALEFNLVVTTADDELDVAFDANDLSLREALALTNAALGPDTISFAPSLAGVSILLTLGQLTISDDVRITGLGASDTVIDAQLASRVFDITSTAGNVTFEGLTITRGKTTGGAQPGGGIRFLSDGTLSLVDSALTSNATTGNSSGGGGVYTRDGAVVVTRSLVSGNTTAGISSPGGGISASAGTVAISDSTVIGNSTAGNYSFGGGVYSSSGDLTLIGSLLTGNQTTGSLSDGGGISTSSAAITIQSSTVTVNSTTGNFATGGGLHSGSGPIAITESFVAINSTSGVASRGGAVGAKFGSITITRSGFAGNSTAGDSAQGGAIYSQFGDVTLVESTLSGNSTAATRASGGAIHTRLGNVFLERSTLSENTTSGMRAHGGGIDSEYGDVSLVNSTLTGNETTGGSAVGGAINLYGGSVTLFSSTVSGNSAKGTGGGIYAYGGRYYVYTDEGGIYEYGGNVLLVSSIVAGNTSQSGAGHDLSFADFYSEASFTAIRSLVGINSGTPLAAAPAGSPDSNGNFVGTLASPIDPRLGPLDDNGGPTQTMALLPGSPAIDAGGEAFLDTDQRGMPFVRIFPIPQVFGTTSDMGAYESQSLSLVVTTADDELDAVYDPNDLSLREALEIANANPEFDTISFAAILSGETIYLSLGELEIRDGVEIDGRGVSETIVDAQQLSRVFFVTSDDGNVTFRNMTITGGKTTGSHAHGGGIRFDSTGTLSLVDAVVTGNSTAGEFADGGGIYSGNGTLTLNGTTVSNNATFGYASSGGGIFSRGIDGPAPIDVSVVDSTISGNSTAGDYAYGGGIFSRNGNLTIESSTVSGNSTAGNSSYGGGVYSFEGSVWIESSSLTGNSTAGSKAQGGGLWSRSHVTVYDSTVTGNSTAGADAKGGALYQLDRDIVVTESLLSGNSTTGVNAKGGAIYARSFEFQLPIELSIIDSTVSNNSTSGDYAYGGGIFGRFATTTLTNSTVSGNSTAGNYAYGGGLYSFIGELTITRSTISGNSTSGDGAHGGGIWNRSEMHIVESTVSGNSTSGASARGGGVYSLEKLAWIEASTFANNSTSGEDSTGGGIEMRGFQNPPNDRPALWITNSTFTGNSTTGEGAAGGGIHAKYAALIVTHGTIAGNSTGNLNSPGGGIAIDTGDLSLTNSIVATNTVLESSGADIDFVDGEGTHSFTAEYSLIGRNEGTPLAPAPVGSPDTDGNLVGTSLAPIDPRLGPLADNGGPTSTRALLVSSPAIDAGGSSTVNTDQRGFPFVRPLGGAPDLGAFELVQDLVVTTADDELDTQYDPADLSLREALEIANALPGHNTIKFDPSFTGPAPTGESVSHVSGVTFLMTLGQFSITDSVTITGLGAAVTIIDAQQLSRVFDITSTAGDVTFESLKITGGKTTGESESGGGIRFLSHGLLTISHGAVSGNSTTGPSAQGGGIYAFDGDILLSSSSVSGNSTTGFAGMGGGISNEYGSLTLNFSTVSGNSTTGIAARGAGINCDYGPVTLNHSTVSGNSTTGENAHGAGIYSYAATITLTDSTVTGNSTFGPHAYGGGIYNDEGSVTLIASTLSGNSTAGMLAHGGGIFVDAATIHVSGSTISGNTTSGERAKGGGIYSRTGNVTLTDSTVSQNSTSAISASGGGISAGYGVVTLVNSTLTGNSTTGESAVGGGIYGYAASILLEHSTLSGNSAMGSGASGGGIYSFGGRRYVFDDESQSSGHFLYGGHVALVNSIVSGNSAADGHAPDIAFVNDFGQATFSASHSLIGNNDGVLIAAAPVGLPDINGNLVGTPAAPIDALLGPLADNGGPTQTMALLEGSPARDAAGSTALPTDQRGAPFARVVGAHADMGAFESQSLTLVVTTNNDELDGDYDANDLSLREALALANANPGHDTITFASSAEGASAGTPGASVLPAGTILLTIGQLTITDTITITGLGADETIIDAQQLSRVFDITSTAGDVTFELLKITGGKTTANFEGGAGVRFLSDGLLTISHCAITENSTTGDVSQGGGIYSLEGDITLTSSSVSGNSTSGMIAPGGGISNEYGSVTLNFSTVSGNTTTGSSGRGGGVNCLYGQVLLMHSTISGNSTIGESAQGAGIYSYAAAITLTDSTVSGNSTSGPSADGGGIYNNRGSITLIASTLSGNSTAGVRAFGGGIFADEATIHVVASTISGNSTSGDNTQGGGIYIRSGDLTLTDSKLSKNTTAGVYSVGGGLYASEGDVTILSSEISENSTTGTRANGGGIYIGSGSVTITDSTVTGNFTSGDRAVGAGINAYSGSITVIQSTVSGNSANGSNAAAGGIYSYGGRKYVYDEEAAEGYYTYGSVTIDNSIVAGNTSSTGNAPDLLLIDAFGETSLSVRFSLIGNNDGTPLDPAPVGSPDIDGNLIGTSLDPIDPLLGPLTDNGGPTRTMALLPGSPARNAGSNALAVDLAGNPLPYDQRGSGFDRIFDGTVDMGAFEFSQAVGQVTIGAQQGTATYGTARSVTYQVTVFRASGFGGSFVADLSVVNSSLPAGTRALFGASSLTFGESDESLSTTLTIQTEFGGSHTPAGQFGFSVRARNAGDTDDFATADRQLTVGKANATIVVSPYNVAFDGNPKTSTGSATGVFGENLAGLDLSGTTHTAPGNYTDVWTFTDSTGNYFNAVGLVQNTIVVPLSTTFVRPRFVPTPISFAELQGGANIPIPSGHTLGFRVDTLNGGTLQITHLGQTTTATVGTLVVAGDTLIWTSPQGATGLNDAFRLAALDLSDNQSLLSLVQIKVNLVNVSPFLSAVTTFTGALQQTPFNITYDMLQGAANEFDANGDALGFRIRTVQNGTLTITRSGTDTPLPVVLAQTLVQPGDLLTWTGGVGQSGNAFPAFTVRAWDGQAGSGVDIQVTIDVTPFGSQFDLSGPWVAAGKLANINQAGSSLTITDENNALSAGLYTALNVISGRNGRTGVVDTTTPDAGRIVWSDGAIWLKLSPGGQYDVSNPNRPNDPPALVRVIQNGGALKFYNRIGDSADATFITPTIIRIPKWQLTATYADGALTISNGLIWRKLDLSPTYTESVSGLGTRVRQFSNLTSDTIELTFTDTVGGTSAGFWLSPAQVRATGWNSTGTVVDGRILWVGGSKDGEIWNKKLVLIGSGNGAGPGFVTIEATSSQITLTNKVGFVMQARLLDPFTLFNVTTGKLITRKNGKLDFGGGLVWSDFDFNALDAVFADINTFPFGS